MKNLANCKPSEFLKQTNKIRKAVSKWLELTKILEIRKQQPEGLIQLTIDMNQEERAKALLKNRELTEAQVKANMSEMLDAMLDEYPDETLEILGLLCFVEPKDIDNHPMTDYIAAMNELIANQAVLGFFTSLMQLGTTVSSLASRP